VLVAGYSGHRRDGEGPRVAGRARQGRSGLDRRCDRGDAHPRRQCRSATCGNLGREALGGRRGRGLAVGLFAPPLLASLAVRAVAGGSSASSFDQNFHDHPDS